MLRNENYGEKLEKVITRATKEDLKDKKGYSSIENFLTEIETVTDTIEYYSRPIKEGYLIKNSRAILATKVVKHLI